MTPVVQESIDLGCSGDESNLLECPGLSLRRRKRQEPTCIVGGVRCAGIYISLVGFLADILYYCVESPQILLSPPSEDGNYVVEVGREVEIRCLLEPNLYSPGPVTLTSYRVDGNEMTEIGNV